jgi:hypothetical protein
MSETMLEPAERDEIARVLAAIPAFAGTTMDRPEVERIGGLTNRNYKITIGPKSYVLRLAGAGTSEYIDREAEAHNARVAAAAGWAPRCCTLRSKAAPCCRATWTMPGL